MSVSWDYVLKYILVGDAGVGKSSLLVRLTDKRFLANPDPTLGVEFGSKLIHIHDENKTIKLQCWDTAGTEAFRSITRSYYRGAAGALLVFDVTSRPSFVNARTWLADIRAHADPHLTCMLIANKTDLCTPDPDPNAAPDPAPAPDPTAEAEPSSSSSAPAPAQAPRPNKQVNRRQVSYEEASLFAKEEGLLFLEASAKTGENVDEAFDQAARDILRKIQQGVFDDRATRGIKTARANANADDPSQLTLEGGRAHKGAYACC